MAKTYPFDIREMDHGHVPDVLAIERASYPAPWSESAFKNEIESGTSVAIVALVGETGESGETGETVAGYLVGWIAADQVNVANIAVDTGHRRMGVGYGMMVWLLEEAIRRGCTSSSLEVRESNLAARSMYIKLGYRAVALRKSFYSNPTEDGVVMLKDLDE